MQKKVEKNISKVLIGFTVERWVAKLLARRHAKAALWVESRHLSKIQNGRHKQGSGQHMYSSPPKK
jgi:hypothetical protein